MPTALPLTDYLPALEPPPDPVEFELRPEWQSCVRGRIHGSCRDDDVDYSVLGLHLLETHGPCFSTEQVGEMWLLRLPYLQTFTAERAAYRNLTAGVKPAAQRDPRQPLPGVDRRPDSAPMSTAGSTPAIRGAPPRWPAATPSSPIRATGCTGRCGRPR